MIVDPAFGLALVIVVAGSIVIALLARSGKI